MIHYNLFWQSSNKMLEKYYNIIFKVLENEKPIFNKY
jgi:hypothetical protein